MPCHAHVNVYLHYICAFRYIFQLHIIKEALSRGKRRISDSNPQHYWLNRLLGIPKDQPSVLINRVEIKFPLLLRNVSLRYMRQKEKYQKERGSNNIPTCQFPTA